MNSDTQVATQYLQTLLDKVREHGLRGGSFKAGAVNDARGGQMIMITWEFEQERELEVAPHGR